MPETSEAHTYPAISPETAEAAQADIEGFYNGRTCLGKYGGNLLRIVAAGTGIPLNLGMKDRRDDEVVRDAISRLEQSADIPSPNKELLLRALRLHQKELVSKQRLRAIQAIHGKTDGWITCRSICRSRIVDERLMPALRSLCQTLRVDFFRACMPVEVIAILEGDDE